MNNPINLPFGMVHTSRQNAKTWGSFLIGFEMAKKKLGLIHPQIIPSDRKIEYDRMSDRMSDRNPNRFPDCRKRLRIIISGGSGSCRWNAGKNGTIHETC